MYNFIIKRNKNYLKKKKLEIKANFKNPCWKMNFIRPFKNFARDKKYFD